MDIQTEEASRQVSEMHRKIVKATNEVKSLKANKKQLQRFNLKAQDQVHRSKVQLLEAQSRIQELEGLLSSNLSSKACNLPGVLPVPLWRNQSLPKLNTRDKELKLSTSTPKLNSIDTIVAILV
mmetsp:Transcript_22866/g.53918  ORF Transcript_22866/g.53918 Transcript_22866/m.53918 type:complete len:124 (+) Transcript_22866:54-425(+)